MVIGGLFSLKFVIMEAFVVDKLLFDGSYIGDWPAELTPDESNGESSSTSV